MITGCAMFTGLPDNGLIFDMISSNPHLFFI